MIRRGWICAHADITQKRQCALAGVSRTTVYAKRRPVVFAEVDEVLKRVQRLMRSTVLAGMAPGPNTSAAHPQH